MNEPKSLSEILKNIIDHGCESFIIFEGFISQNGPVSHLDLSNYLKIVILFITRTYEQKEN